MSVLGGLFAALRQVMTVEHRIEELTGQVAELKRREEDTRERLVRLETIIDEARRRGEARRDGTRRLGDGERRTWPDPPNAA